MAAPTEIGPFLEWFGRETEASWDVYQPRTFDDYVAARVGGVDWQPRTRWLRDLPEGTIAGIERTWNVRFPPDYRLFLQMLHAVDRPMRGAAYANSTEMEPVERPAFYNWLDAAQIRAALDSLLDGILFDVEKNGLWPDAWGPRPATDRRPHLERLISTAPQLIPIFGHRFLLAWPSPAGHPVLSIHQSDAVIYWRDLREYLLNDFATLLPIDQARRVAIPEEVWSSVRQVPFWGDLLG